MIHDVCFRVKVSDDYSKEDVVLMMLAGLDNCKKVTVFDSKVIASYPNKK